MAEANTTKKSFDVKGLVKTVTTAVKSAVPASKGGKIVAGSALGVTAVGSFLLGRASKKTTSKK